MMPSLSTLFRSLHNLLLFHITGDMIPINVSLLTLYELSELFVFIFFPFLSFHDYLKCLY